GGHCRVRQDRRRGCGRKRCRLFRAYPQGGGGSRRQGDRDGGDQAAVIYASAGQERRARDESRSRAQTIRDLETEASRYGLIRVVCSDEIVTRCLKRG